MRRNLKNEYREKVIGELQKKRGYSNVMEVPRLEKIVVNMGLGEASQNSKIIDIGVNEITAITGQKPIVTKAKKAISTFKIRKNLPIGCKVTLRGQRMYDFYSKLVNLISPRLRDFKGVSNKSFDGKGNYTLGLKEQTVFPEVHYEKVDDTRGMDIAFVTTARTDDEAKDLLAALGMPFKK